MFYSKKFRKFKEINHCFFSRKNGFSKGIYKSLNCGRGSRDSKKNIIKNLQFVSEKINVISSIFVPLIILTIINFLLMRNINAK